MQTPTQGRSPRFRVAKPLKGFAPLLFRECRRLSSCKRRICPLFKSGLLPSMLLFRRWRKPLPKRWQPYVAPLRGTMLSPKKWWHWWKTKKAQCHRNPMKGGVTLECYTEQCTCTVSGKITIIKVVINPLFLGSSDCDGSHRRPELIHATIPVKLVANHVAYAKVSNPVNANIVWYITAISITGDCETHHCANYESNNELFHLQPPLRFLSWTISITSFVCHGILQEGVLLWYPICRPEPANVYLS